MARPVPFSLQPPPHDVDARAAATAATSRALRAALDASLRSASPASASPAQARGSPFADALTRLCTVLRTSASATAPTSAHCRSRYSRHPCRSSRRRSCGARRHHARHCLAQCAPHRRPLNRRGGSDPPGSPASIFRSFIQRESTIRPAGPALGSTPHASMMLACHRALCPVLSGTFAVNQGPGIVGPSAMRTPCADRHRPDPRSPRLSPAHCARHARSALPHCVRHARFAAAPCAAMRRIHRQMIG